jgi:NAD(P)-dependent dehydrogenase (short-subunit alcohol dehydrogenase family)
VRGLDAKRVIVTGAGRSVGLAIARRLVAEGAAVAVVDIDPAAGAEAADDLGCTFIEADVTSADGFAAAVDTARAALGGLTTLVNNVGEGTLKRLHEYTPEEFERSLRINLLSAFHGIRAVIPVFLEGAAASSSTTPRAAAAPSRPGARAPTPRPRPA